MVRHRSMRSSTAGSRMMMLRLAASEIAPMIATGMPIRSGHGVATRSTGGNGTGLPAHAKATIAQWECNRRVTGAKLIAQPPELWTALLGTPHHRHDAGISRIDGQARRPERERVLSIDRAGEHLGSGSLRHHERLPGQVRLVHDTLPLDDHPVTPTDPPPAPDH